MDDPASVDAYIAGFPPQVQDVLRTLRQTIGDAAPGATESISYRIPTFRLGGRPLMYFAGFARHVSVYPIPEGDAEFEALVAPYRAGKGTLRFPLDRPVPFAVVRRVAEAHVRRLAAGRQR